MVFQFKVRSFHYSMVTVHLTAWKSVLKVCWRKSINIYYFTFFKAGLLTFLRMIPTPPLSHPHPHDQPPPPLTPSLFPFLPPAVPHFPSLPLYPFLFPPQLPSFGLPPYTFCHQSIPSSLYPPPHPLQPPTLPNKLSVPTPSLLPDISLPKTDTKPAANLITSSSVSV